MDKSVVVSTPPHVKSRRTTRNIMLDVIIALIPCCICGIVFFGWKAAVIEIISVISCVAAEFVYFFIAHGGFAKKCKNAKEVCVNWIKQFDFTSIITGIILAMIVPVPETAKYFGYMIGGIVIGSVFSIAVVKMIFGGTGKNLVNPAAAGRVFMFLSFTVAMTSYSAPLFGAVSSADAGLLQSGATNLSGEGFLLSDGFSPLSPLDLFLGSGVYGCIGETCKIAIIVGYLYLAVRKVIKWWQPVLFLGIFGFVAVFLSGFTFDKYTFDMGLYLPHVLSGGVMFAAVFMFTDYVSSPKGVYGQLVYVIVGAVLLAVLRHFTGIEVASFVILFMNLFVPLIDKYIRRKPFGYVKEKKVKKEGN